jgi:small-conductance mechanosensitive channel
MMIEGLSKILEPWSTLYGESTVVSTLVTSAHILGMLVGGGLAISADRSTLRALRQPPEERRRHLTELAEVHRPVLWALAIIVATGVLLAAADVQTFIGSAVFWTKMGLIALLLGNGAVLYRTERRLTRAVSASITPSIDLWDRLRLASLVSLGLWLVVAASGVILTSVA